VEAGSSSGAYGRQLESRVHGGLMLRRTQGGGQYSPRWSLLCLCRILCTSWIILGLRVVLGVDRLRVGFKSDSVAWASHIMRGAPHIVTYDDLIATGAQGEPAACTGDQGGRYCGIMGRSARSHTPQM
jgi:hypothetical protein